LVFYFSIIFFTIVKFYNDIVALKSSSIYIDPAPMIRPSIIDQSSVIKTCNNNNNNIKYWDIKHFIICVIYIWIGLVAFVYSSCSIIIILCLLNLLLVLCLFVGMAGTINNTYLCMCCNFVFRKFNLETA